MKVWLTLLNLIVAAALWTGCKSPYTPIKTLAEVGLEARTTYAAAYVRGVIPPEVHVKAMRADEEYLKAQRALRVVLEEAAAVGAQPDTTAALRRAKEALVPLLEVITLYVSKPQGARLQTELTTAKAE